MRKRTETRVVDGPTEIVRADNPHALPPMRLRVTYSVEVSVWPDATFGAIDDSARVALERRGFLTKIERVRG
jgi:hypothetical protein